MSSISSPKLLTPPRPTSAAVRAREISEILVYSPPCACMPFSVKVVKGAALDDSSPLTTKCSPATSNPHKSPVFIPQKADLASRYPKCFSLDILGINRADRGCHCKEHATCGLSLKENSLVCIRCEVFAFNKAGKVVEEAALAVYTVNMGVDRCRVGFLPHAFVKTGTLYDGVLCQASIFFIVNFIMTIPSSNTHQSSVR
jgi:hypothetical protein